MIYNNRLKGQFISERNFSREELINALVNYKEKSSISGNKNPIYVNGKNGEYIRIRVNGIKVMRSNIVYMIYHNLSRIPLGFCIHHRNGNKKDDRVENLELIDQIKHGTMNLKNEKI